MKCIILAGGSGNRLWPLSRKNYPKQFIQIHSNHSLFQETIARNLPFCDEFVIVTNKNCKYIIENQMQVFHGTTYQCVYEEIGRKTTAAILLSCMQFADSELVFVVAADQVIERECYKDDILKAKELARNGHIVSFALPASAFQNSENLKLYSHDTSLAHTGMFLFEAGMLLNELRVHNYSIYNNCLTAFKQRLIEQNDIYYTEKVLFNIPPISFDDIVDSNDPKYNVLKCRFTMQDINVIEDVHNMRSETNSLDILRSCENTAIINQCNDKIVVANHLQDIQVINTPDAVYVGKYGTSRELKNIINENLNLKGYFDSGTLIYRSWGYFEVLSQENNYRIKKVFIHPGKTIYSHEHKHRNEYWTVLEGDARITIGPEEKEYTANGHAVVPISTVHQVSNIGDSDLVIIEVAVGQFIADNDMVSVNAPDLNEGDLGMEIDPFVKLKPVFKDYLWGGTKLRDIYGKECDYDIIAESWELSAHKAGQSVVDSGRHKGMGFRKYLDIIGKENWGWKCQSLKEFPVLVKFIDARQFLSVQVHPDDDYALEVENEYGKNEMWYIMECEEGAGIYCGFNKAVTKEEVKSRIQDGSILDILNWIPVEKGASFFIPAGTVHAIGQGCLIYELQQNSNSTYRLYDFNRKDKYGNYRELHLDKALDVSEYKIYNKRETESYLDEFLCMCKYFNCKHLIVKNKYKFNFDGSSFGCITCIDGKVSIECRESCLDLCSGETIFIPSCTSTIALDGNGECLAVHI